MWITKYALTQGIEVLEVEEPSQTQPSIITVQRPGRFTEYYHGQGNDWHLSEKAALERAEIMRNKKIISLEKQIKKLKTLKLEVK